MESQEFSPIMREPASSLESDVLPGSALSLQGCKTAVASFSKGKWWV